MIYLLKLNDLKVTLILGFVRRLADDLEKLLTKPRDCYDMYDNGEHSDGVYT